MSDLGNPIVTIQVFKGEPSIDTEITGDLDEIVYGHADYYTVLQSPGAFIAAIGLTNLILAASALTVAAAFLLTPKAPGYVGQAGNSTTSSPNNELASGRTKSVYCNASKTFWHRAIYPVVADAKLLEVHQQYSV